MTRNQILNGCNGMSKGETRTFTLDDGQSIKFLSGEITEKRRDGLAVSLNRSGNQVEAHCYDSQEKRP